jgi:hypothetical protein
MSECNPFIGDDFVFPRRPFNRPALDHVDYRVATYAEFVERMVRSINDAVELRTWTHRAPDDPGIALLQGAAIVGDILTFYQERYANEAFLRTATWRNSIAALVRLLGYRLAPGVGGHATFAFEVKKQLDLPAAFALKADLEDVDGAVDFQTSDAITAYPHLSRFSLYRARQYGASLVAGTTRLEIQSAGGSTLGAAIDDVGLKKGDRLMLMPNEPTWATSNVALSGAQKTPQTVKVKSVKRQLGRTIVELETALQESWSLPVTAYRLGRSWRHFGHNAGPKIITNTLDTNGHINGATQRDTSFVRHIRGNHDCTISDASIALPGELIPLDQSVSDLTVGTRIVVRTIVQNNTQDTFLPFAVAKTITALRDATIGFGAVTGPSTLVTMDSALHHGSYSTQLSDVRDYHIDEVTSPALALAPEATFSSAAFASGADALSFYGTVADVTPTAGRRVLLVRGSDEPLALTCTSDASTFTSSTPSEPQMWPLSFDRPPAPFTQADFDETTPTVVVFGNLADATQGKAQPEVVLGNGDARARFQTFKIPKSPLTYLLASGETPPQRPELDLRVNGNLWTRVDALFGHASDDEVYVVREDADGSSYVQFGDGKTGARLPSGIQNVTAAYRTGNGAHGPIKAGATPSAGKRVEGLDKVQLPGVVTGGDTPEAGDDAREAAPGKIQSLGRLVSLRDYETETLTIPGVTTATAAWGLVDGVPALTLTVLLAAGREAEFQAVRDTIQSYQRCRGPDRFAVHVVQAFLRYAYLDLQYAFQPRLRQEDVEVAIRAALGLAGDDASARTGVFGLRHRGLGAAEYATRIEGVVQDVSGVMWCRVGALGLFAAGATDPLSLALPAAPRARAELLTPATNEVLQLHPTHLTLTAAPAPPAGECS